MSVAPIEETVAVTLTEAAADKLAIIMAEKGVRETHGLRVFVSGGGCSGRDRYSVGTAGPSGTSSLSAASPSMAP